MKKSLFATAFIIILMLLSLTANAGIISSGECGANGNNVTWTLDDQGVLTISGTGKMKDYTSSSASPWGVSVKTVKIESGVTSIGGYAFFNCAELTGVTIPEGVTSIGDLAFACCTALTSVTIPEGVTSIGDDAFGNCTELTSVTIPDGVTSIGASAFSNCKKLTNITIPDSVTSIGDGAFIGCRKITNITIPDGVTSIGDDVFSGCSGLTSITIPESVISIGDCAFYGAGLTSITIPDSVTSIGNSAFAWCLDLTSITIPDGVTSIGNRLFYYCESLTSVTIPDGVTSIGDEAFDVCTELTSITIPDGVKSIGAGAFGNCSGLTSITIPDGVTKIGRGAFVACTGLTSITVPEGITNINFFPYCTGLTSITIPESVTSIGDTAFSHCTGLTSITIPKSVTSIGDSAFSYCTGLTSITVPDSVTSIGDWAFSDCTKLTNITIPDSVTSIGDDSFRNCYSLTSITIPDSVTSIGAYTFIYCSGLTSITIPDSVTSIGDSAFSLCTGLTSITIPENVTSIGSGAFSYCTRLASITIPESLVSVGPSAFVGCSRLTDVYYKGKNREDIIIGEGNDFLKQAEWHYGNDQPTKSLIHGFVSRCYSVILGRAPDPEGLNAWADALATGARAASEIIDGFVNSPEFLNKGLSRDQQVVVLYKAMLGREPDPAGLAAWTDVLNQGYPFGSVINGFCGSDEFKALCAEYGIQPGSVNVGPVTPAGENKIKAFVRRCYSVILGRDPDAAGLDAWANALATGEAKASEIIDGFVNSQEFLNKGLSHEASVKVLYNAMLGRDPDPAGLAAWVKVLDDGNPFAAVINGFCGSIEFTNLCAEYGIQPGSVQVKAAFVKRVSITPEDSDAEESATYVAYASEYINEEKIRAFVKHCYETVLGREGDEEGIANYTALVMDGKKTPKRVAYEFVFSPEFQGKIPGNEELVKILYRLYLNREPGAEELAGWIEMLDGGAGLDEVLKGFAESAEFRAIMREMKE